MANLVQGYLPQRIKSGREFSALGHRKWKRKLLVSSLPSVKPNLVQGDLVNNYNSLFFSLEEAGLEWGENATNVKTLPL